MSIVEQTVSAQEAADLLGIDIRSVRDWLKKGQIKSIRGPGNTRRILRSSISELQPNQRSKSKRLFCLQDRYIHGFQVPAGFDLITTYAELAEYSRAFANGELSFLLLVGSPGSGKSRQVKSELAKVHHTWIDSHATNLGLYCSVYEADGTPIVLDDINHFFKNPVAVSLMKALTQTERVRSVSWESTTKALKDRNVPRQFTTTSSICLIANKWNGDDADMAAVQDRSLPVAFFPSAQAIHEQVKALKWCSQEVWKFIGKNLNKIRQPSMREYYQGMVFLKAGMKWQDKLLKLWEVNQ